MTDPYRAPPPSTLRFVQIATSQGQSREWLYGLDSEGRVWFWQHIDHTSYDRAGWVPLSMDQAHPVADDEP